MKNLLADIDLFPKGQQFTGIGPLGSVGANAPQLFNRVLSIVIGVMTVVAFIWFTFQLIIGAIRIVTSGGDKAALEGARKQITTGLVGVVIVIAAMFILSLIGTLLNVDFLKGALFIDDLLK